MNAKKCDICGNFYNLYGGKSCALEQCNALKLIAIEDKTYWSERTLEFCPDCKRKLYEFLNIK